MYSAGETGTAALEAALLADAGLWIPWPAPMRLIVDQ
jgi:hypothetical protein